MKDEQQLRPDAAQCNVPRINIAVGRIYKPHSTTLYNAQQTNNSFLVCSFGSECIGILFYEHWFLYINSHYI